MNEISKIVKIEIVTGFSCNNNCKFCSVRRFNFDKLTDEIKKDIERAIKERPKEINFTGGEPTIRKDIFELIEYVNERKIKEIRVTTNGRMFSYEDFTKKAIKAGLTGAIFSIHGHTSQIHDYLTNVKGAFEQAMQGLKNLREFTNNIDVNTVITTKNYKFLPNLAEMLIEKYDIRALCLIFPTIDGNLLNHLDLVPSYNQVVDSLHKTIDIIKERNKTVWTLNMPICFFKGYEKYSSITELKTKVFWPDVDTNLDEKRKENKVKVKACEKCRYRLICHGIPKDYLKIKGESGINPIEGKIIKNVEEIYKVL